MRENWKNTALIMKLTMNSRKLGADGGGGVGRGGLIAAVGLVGGSGSGSMVISESEAAS